MTPKQEAFARAYVETGNASEAYRRAYNAEKMSDEAIRVEACRLLDNPNVSLTVEKLQAKHQKRHEITVDKLTEMALAAFKEAQRIAPTSGQMQTSSMVKAAEFLGKLHGLIVDRSEVTHKDGVEDLTEAELANIARSGRRGTVTPAGGSSQSH
jgi:phage terminase small subunit